MWEEVWEERGDPPMCVGRQGRRYWCRMAGRFICVMLLPNITHEPYTWVPPASNASGSANSGVRPLTFVYL